VALYVVWTALTYALEGRLRTLLRPDAVLLRFIYAIAANLVVGTVGALWLARRYVTARAVRARWLGADGGVRSVIAIVCAVLAGVGLYAAQQPPSARPVVILNGFAQVLVVSIAEVLVCWVVIGAGVQVLLRGRGRLRRTAAAGIVSALAFGLYHYAHSPPFNTMQMVALLTVIGLATSLFFALSRDVYGTIVFHNFLALTGVLRALDRAGSLATFSRPQPALLGMAAVAATTLVLLRTWLSSEASEASA
jgi:hypothetical protein